MKIKKTKKISKLKLIIIIGAIIYVCYGLWVSYAKAIEIQQKNQEIEENYKYPVAPAPVEVILKYSLEYGVDPNLLYSTLWCESSLNPQVESGDAGQSHGIAQIKDATWVYLENKLGEDLDQKSYYDSIKLTAFAFSISEGNNWSAYRAIKNGGSYTFFYKLTGKQHTVYCNYQKML